MSGMEVFYTRYMAAKAVRQQLDRELAAVSARFVDVPSEANSNELAALAKRWREAVRTEEIAEDEWEFEKDNVYANSKSA